LYYALSFRRVLIRSCTTLCHFGGFSFVLVLCVVISEGSHSFLYYLCHFGGFSFVLVLRIVISGGSHLCSYYPLSFGQFLGSMIMTQGGPLTPDGHLGNGVPETTKSAKTRGTPEISKRGVIKQISRNIRK
jgi:hypothetical protein